MVILANERQWISGIAERVSENRANAIHTRLELAEFRTGAAVAGGLNHRVGADSHTTWAEVLGDIALEVDDFAGRIVGGLILEVKNVDRWKVTFLEQNTEISPKTPMGVWSGQFTTLRTPKIYNLRSDPFERGPDSIEYADWFAHRSFILVPAQALVASRLESFKGVSAARQSREFHRQRCDGEDHVGAEPEQVKTPVRLHPNLATSIDSRLSDSKKRSTSRLAQ